MTFDRPRRTLGAGRHPVALLAVLLPLVTGCAGGRPIATGEGRCGAGPVYCLTARVCAWDRVAGCERCRCADAPYVPAAR